MSSHNSMFQSYSVLQNISLPSYSLLPADDTDKENKPFCGYETIGGVLSDSKFVWNANGSLFTVYDVKNGTKIAAWNFGSVIKSCTTTVSCVVELPRPARKSPFLIIGLQRENYGQICIFNIRGPKVLRCIEINEKVTSLCVVGAEHEMSALGMYLRGFDGVVAVGTSSGNVYLIDINRLNCEEACLGFEVDVQDEIDPCQLQTVTLEDLLENNCENLEHSCILLNGDESEIEFFALKGPKNEVCVYVTKDEVEVSALHYCSQLGSVLVGFNFGAWQIWDLINMKLIYTSPVYQENIPVSHFGVQQPCDDPRAFCYIWTIYSNTEPDQPGYSLAVLYSLNLKKKEFVEGCGFLFKKFNSCSVRFQMDVTNCQKEMEVSNALIRAQCIKLQTISKKISRNFFGVHQDETVTVCSIVWNVWNSNLPRTCKTYLTLFDLNQWYKELMPGSPNPKDCEAYLTHVCLTNVLQPNDNRSMLDLQINSDTIIQFTGSQKLEEHYYPSSLAFQIIALGKTSITIIDNQGNQRALLASLESDGPSVLLKPTEAFLLSINFGLIPLFVDMPDEASIEFKRKLLLSVALEQKLLGWLCKCVCTWSSGVYENTGCSLNFLLSWGWQRAQVLKENINRLSIILFDYSGLRLDANTHNLLNHCLSQLKNITTLFKFIQKKFLCFVLNPDTVRDQCKYLEMASTHLEVFDWLLNVGLLPEYPECDYPRIDPFGCTNVPYRVNSLNKYYHQRRTELNSLAIKQFSSRDSLLLIDNLIDVEFGRSHLLKQGNVVSECTVYPPQSLQALMRTYLVENVSLLQKHFVVAYLLLDISATLDHEHKLYESTIAHLLKFPAVFHLSASVTKIIQSFWQLDHGNFQAAVEQLLDPMVSANDLKLWHHKVILKALLAQGQYNLALTYFQVRQPAVTEVNDLFTIISLFVANNLIDDAFRFQRQNQSSDITPALLHHFFKDCDKAGNLKSILVLRLTKEEEDLFIKYLNEVNHPQANELKICYCTQHTRYVDAMQVYDKTGKIKAGSRGLDGQHELSDTDNIINKLTNFCNPFKKSIIDRLTKKDLNVLKVSNPQPFSVFVHNTEEQVKYKSSVIEAALVKAKETWNQTSQNVTKSIIYDDIPFLNTPRAISSVARISSPIIYPKLTSLKDEDNPLLPPKRFKPMSRLTIPTVDNNYDLDITCKKLSVRLEMPVVKRKLSKNLERQVVQEVNTETPQSILKSQTHTFSTSSRGDDNILTSDSIKDNRSSISSDRNTPYKSNIYDLSEDDDYDAVDPKLNLSDVSNDLTLNEAMCIVDDNILEIESNSNYIADSDEVFGDKSEVNVTYTVSSNEHKNNIEVEDMPEGKAESEGLLKHSSSDVEVIELSSSIDDVYSSDDENIFTSENGSSVIPTDSEESIPSNSTSNDIDDTKTSVNENMCVNTVEEAQENIEVTYTNLSENPILLDTIYEEEEEDEPKVNNSQIIVPSDLRKSYCEASTIVIHVDSFNSKDTVDDSEKVIESKSVEGEQNVNELDSAEQQAEEIASSNNNDDKLNEFVRSSDTNSHVIIPEKSIFDDSVNITPNREMNSVFHFNKDTSNKLFMASTPLGSIMFNDQSYDSDILDKTAHHTPGNWLTVSELLITPANERQIVNQTNTTDYLNDVVEETPPKSSNNSKIDDWFDTPVKRSQRLSSLQASSTPQTSDLRKYTLRKRSLSTSQVNTNTAPVLLKQSPIKIVKKQVPSKRTRSSSTNAPLSVSTRSKRGGSVHVELLSEKLPESNKKVSPSTPETKTKIISRKSKSAVVSNDILEVYSSTRRLTRRQANLLRKNLGTDINELQKVEKEGSSNSDDSDRLRERGPDIAEMDAIKLLDKKSFEGDPDPDEELVHKSPVSSIAESPIGLRLRSKSSLSNVPVCSEKSSVVGETKRRNVKRRLPGGDALLETRPQSKSPESKSKNVPRKLRKTRANSKDTDISESSTISQAHSVVEAKKPGRITRRTRSTEEIAQPRLRRHERSILSKSNLPNIVEEYTGPSK